MNSRTCLEFLMELYSFISNFQTKYSLRCLVKDLAVYALFNKFTGQVIHTKAQ